MVQTCSNLTVTLSSYFWEWQLTPPSFFRSAFGCSLLYRALAPPLLRTGALLERGAHLAAGHRPTAFLAKWKEEQRRTKSSQEPSTPWFKIFLHAFYRIHLPTSDDTPSSNRPFFRKPAELFWNKKPHPTTHTNVGSRNSSESGTPQSPTAWETRNAHKAYVAPPTVVFLRTLCWCMEKIGKVYGVWMNQWVNLQHESNSKGCSLPKSAH